jgi:transposase
MKSNRNQLTNQRIEKITMNHAVVGIDIAKDVHAAQMTNFRGSVLTPRHCSFTNSVEGFEKLLRWIRSEMEKHRLSSVVVGMEPTGHYWFNLANWLKKQGIEVVLVNPVTTHRNKENRDNSPSKDDPKDSLTISDCTSRGFYSEYEQPAPEFARLKTLINDREYWSKISTSLGNRIVRWIDLYFPEFRSVFPDWTIRRSLASLLAFPLPCDLQDQTVDKIIAGWREQGMKRAGGSSGRAKAAELLAAARRSIGESGVPDEARLDIRQLVQEYERLQALLDGLEQRVKDLLGQLPQTEILQSIPGFGIVATAAVLGLAGDLRQYAHGRQLLRRAGLNLAQCKSGKYQGQIKLSKRGDSALRKHLFLGVVGLVQKNPEFKRWHAENQAKGMKKMASIYKLIGKLARIMVGMIQRGETYRPGQQAPAAAA